MRHPRIYTDRALSPATTIELDEAAARHLTRALRLGPGAPLLLFNGDGRAYPASLAQVDKRRVTATVHEALEASVESPLRVHLGIGLSRGDRMDWVVQKATELGAAAISPLFTERSEVKLSPERASKKLRHWRQVAISACEQCGRNRLPELALPTALGDWVAGADAESRLVLHHRALAAPATDGPPASVALLIGPEGGLSDTEIALAEATGFTGLRLGPRVLRTETAPLAALAILQSRWGDMG